MSLVIDQPANEALQPPNRAVGSIQVFNSLCGLRLNVKPSGRRTW